MRLSTRGKYGLYAMYYLAQHAGEGPKSLQNIATMDIPQKYLEQLLGNLRRSGLVTTVRGAQGGYQIAKQPEDISLLDVIDAVEGPVELSECTSDIDFCARASACPVREIWSRLTMSINQEFSKISLQNVLEMKEEELQI